MFIFRLSLLGFGSTPSRLGRLFSRNGLFPFNISISMGFGGGCLGDNGPGFGGGGLGSSGLGYLGPVGSNVGLDLRRGLNGLGGGPSCGISSGFFFGKSVPLPVPYGANIRTNGMILLSNNITDNLFVQ